MIAVNKIKELTEQISWKVVVYTFLFCFISGINQRIHTASPLAGWREAFRDMTGLVIGVIILMHYTKAELLKYRKLHLIWTVVGSIVSVILFFTYLNCLYFPHDKFVVALDILLWGYVVIQTVMTVFKERRYPKFHKGLAVVWIAMSVLMVVSRDDSVWPLAYTVMFVFFYATDFTKLDREQMFQGLLNGIILSFFAFQGLAFLHRPYDRARYLGWFTNSNNNVLFYCFVLAAVLVKLYMCYQKNANKWWKLYYWLGVGTVFSFVILTIGRIGWITSFVLAFLFLIFARKDFGKKIITTGLVVILCTAVTFPLCFAAIRYIPPLRHHVYWFFGEYGEDRVHSNDPWNSEKYVEIDEFAERALGRIATSFIELWENSPFVMEIDAAQEQETVTTDAVTQELDPRFIPALDMKYRQNGYMIRTTIYKYFLTNLNMTGHKAEEIGLQLFEGYWVGHAHNIYLQFGTQFGIPMLVLFIVMLIGSLGTCLKKFRQTKSVEAMGDFYIILIPALFGIFEYCWGAGSLTLTLLYVAWRMAVVKEE